VLALALIPGTSLALVVDIELTGSVAIISAIDPSVAAPLAALGVQVLAPVTAHILWDADVPGMDDPTTGKTVYEGAVLDFTVEIDSYMVAHEPSLPRDDVNAVTVGDDKEAVASALILDSVFAQAAGLDTNGISARIRPPTRA
jgi:hypothetical protein